ncbi:putative delta-lactam-biosynthetic de-N-acetylase [Erysipelotrichaceae bacterium 3_1_53]|nr:putative delta-lactam-biosynthetic de-N-acetylase [Erysipelotrichaceae bacterium 3_1_53]
MSKKVKCTGSVNMKKQGTYTLTYTVKDNSGNAASVQRSVQVCADPTATKLYYDHDSYDNTMEEWWFNKSKDHQRTTGAKDEKLLKKYDAYYQGPKEKVIYLTFDEGGNDITYIKQIADVLKKNNVQATYFLTRNYIKTEADFIRQLVKDGNVIGNHSWHHYDMTTLANAASIDTFVAEITETEKTYMEVTGQPMKKVFRFPKGGSSERAMKLVKDLGYSNYFWSHAYYDYASDVSGTEALKTMMDHYHEGAIYLLHPSNKGNYEAMDTFIKNMKELGYSFKTVDTIPADAKDK